MTETTPRPTPWYRQGWPWFIISLPASAVIAGITTVIIAFAHRDDLVRDDWYKDGLAINQRLDGQLLAAQRQIHADIVFDHGTRRISATLGGDLPALPALLSLELIHPTHADRDKHITLARLPEGTYAGVLEDIVPSRYTVRLADPSDHWQITQRVQTGNGHERHIVGRH